MSPGLKRLPAYFYRLDSGRGPGGERLKGVEPEDRRAIGEDISLLRLNWFFPNPIQRIRGSTSHRQRRPPLRPAVSSLIWTAVSPNTNVRMSGIEVWSNHTDGQCEGFWDSFPQVVIQRRFILLSDVQKY